MRQDGHGDDDRREPCAFCHALEAELAEEQGGNIINRSAIRLQRARADAAEAEVARLRAARDRRAT